MQQRLYTPAELERYFGDRDHFRSMTCDQVRNIFGYLEAKYKIKSQALADIVHPESQLIEITDAEVYARLQNAQPEPAVCGDDYHKTQASILVQSYRSMCRKRNYNFKQPLGAVMDLGSSSADLCFHLKREFYAKYALGLPLDKYKLEDCSAAMEKLRELKDGQIDIINCDSVLHSVTDSAMRSLLDQIIRVCARYVVIKDFELGDDYQIMKQFAIMRELASGVLVPSDIPNCILADEDGCSDPASFYNLEFSVDRVIQYLTAEAFEVVAQPALKKSVGNPRIYILKRAKFAPWVIGEDNWNAPANKNPKLQDINKIKSKLFRDARGLQGKAVKAPTRDTRQQQVTQLLNKLSAYNCEELGQRLVSVFSSTYQTVSAEEREDFVCGITSRLFSRAKTCRNTAHMFADVYKQLIDTEHFISDTAFIHDQVLALCGDLVLNTTRDLDPADGNSYEELSAQLKCVVGFVTQALHAQAISHRDFADLLTRLAGTTSKSPADHIQTVLDLTEGLARFDPSIVALVPLDLYAIASSASGRVKCIALNGIDLLKSLGAL